MKVIDRLRPVAVTGGTGYLASWIIKHLLDQGMIVKTSVRNLSGMKAVNLMKLQESSDGRLNILQADLLKSGDFDNVVKDCEVVIHTASPFRVSGVKDFKSEVIDPALEGTRNVLSSVNRTPSVKRVVLTSSVASIYGDAADTENKPSRIITPDDWNVTSSENHQPYSYSKTIAEKEAWKLASTQDRWELVTIHPGFILGPSLTTRKDSTSIDFMISFLTGRFRFGVPDLWFGFVDVRDAAMMHIKAGFTPGAHGRYIAVQGSYSMVDVAEKIIASFGDKYPVSSRKLPAFLFYVFGPLMGFSLKFVRRNIGHPLKFDNSAGIRELGISYRPIEQTIIDQISQIGKDGLV
jgi:nucleoside-diphosphate-sugar epimerase